jgi:hypothetical protein
LCLEGRPVVGFVGGLFFLNKGFESKLSILYMVLSRVRISYPLQWGSPTFDAGDVFGVMTAAFAALVEVFFFFQCTQVFIVYYW